MLYRLENGTELRAKTAADFVHQFHGMSFAPEDLEIDDVTWMKETAKRLRGLYARDVDTTSARAFVNDLIEIGLVTAEEEE